MNDTVPLFPVLANWRPVVASSQWPVTVASATWAPASMTFTLGCRPCIIYFVYFSATALISTTKSTVLVGVTVGATFTVTVAVAVNPAPSVASYAKVSAPVVGVRCIGDIWSCTTHNSICRS